MSVAKPRLRADLPSVEFADEIVVYDPLDSSAHHLNPSASALCGLFGLYGQMWRYASVQEARRVVLAGLSATVTVVALALWLGRGGHLLPWSVLVGGGIGSLIGFGGIRFQNRLFAFRRYGEVSESKR